LSVDGEVFVAAGLSLPVQYPLRYRLRFPDVRYKESIITTWFVLKELTPCKSFEYQDAAIVEFRDFM